MKRIWNPVLVLLMVALLAGCAKGPQAVTNETAITWRGRGTNAIPSVLMNGDTLYYIAADENRPSMQYLMRRQAGQTAINCSAKDCEHDAWDCPAAVWNDSVGLMQYGEFLYARSIGAGAVVRYDLSGTVREEILPREEKVEAFAIGEETLWAVAQPVEGGFALLVLPLDNPDAQPGRILFADDTEVIGTDDALYQSGALWVSQSVRTDGKVGMRIARIDPEKQKMETVVLSAADSVVSLSSGVLAYNASTEEGYQVCLLDLASGETMRLRTGSAPWDVIATESGFALDNRLQQGEPRTVVWITLAGETLGSTALDKTLEPCSGAMGDDLVYVSATKPGEITFVPCAQEKD